MMDILRHILTPEFGYSVLRISTPIIFATLGAMISTRAGVLNIALEGIMLLSALLGVVFSAFIPSVWVSLLLTISVAGFVGFLLGYLSIKLKSDIILTGIAFNLIAAGGTVFLLYLLTGQKGVSTSLASQVLPRVKIPLLDKLPFIGESLAGVFSNHNVLTYLSIIAVVVLYLFVYKTPLGLRIRAVGENPKAAESVGINVHKTQYIALVISGVLCGLGGAFMSMGYLSWFGANMTAGRGFIAMAANGMGGATPVGGFIVSLFFGFADAFSNGMQGVIKIPTEIIRMLPYLATVVGLVVYNIQKRKRALKAKMMISENNE
ncbi:ABC transporter permease [Mycoplasmatota bacterium WC44]